MNIESFKDNLSEPHWTIIVSVKLPFQLVEFVRKLQIGRTYKCTDSFFLKNVLYLITQQEIRNISSLYVVKESKIQNKNRNGAPWLFQPLAFFKYLFLSLPRYSATYFVKLVRLFLFFVFLWSLGVCEVYRLGCWNKLHNILKHLLEKKHNGRF